MVFLEQQYNFHLLGRLEGKGSTKLTGGAWNPHQNCQQYATVNEHTVRGWDIRTMKQTWCISECFSTSVRAIDFNPNKQYQIATGTLKFVENASVGLTNEKKLGFEWTPHSPLAPFDLILDFSLGF